MAGAAYNRGASKQDYETPWELIHAIQARWGKIEWDLAASSGNTKALRFITAEENALGKNWHALKGAVVHTLFGMEGVGYYTIRTGPVCFLNPPYSYIEPWAAKCAEEEQLGARILLLVPASVGSNWFADYVHKRALVCPLNPRVSFDGRNPYPKDVMVCAYGFGKTGFEPWRWK